MELFNVLVIFLTILCTGVLLSIYIFYMFFMKNIPETDDMDFEREQRGFTPNPS
jgi:hypothetical protein